jgi:predicted RNase H-like HicB family nuclease
MRLRMELEQEDDGRWIAEIPELPGVLVYGSTREGRFERCRRWLFE